MTERFEDAQDNPAGRLRPAPVPPSPAANDTPSSSTESETPANDPGDAEAGARTAPRDDDAGQTEVGGETDTSFDLPPALGTSEGMEPVQGVHRPDVGPGADDFDTAERPVPGRTSQSREA